MPEFGQHGLEVRRQPLEDKIVTIPSAALRGRFAVSRAQGSLTFPANFMLVGAQTPCPCGYWGDPEHACSCSPMLHRANQICSALISRYQKRLSGPLLDRIDITYGVVSRHVEVPRVPFQKLSSIASTTSAAGSHRRTTFGTIRARVEAARARQSARIANVKDSQNAQGAGLTTNADTPRLQLR